MNFYSDESTLESVTYQFSKESRCFVSFLSSRSLSLSLSLFVVAAGCTTVSSETSLCRGNRCEKVENEKRRRVEAVGVLALAWRPSEPP